MLFSRYNLLKNHGEFVHLNMLKWALKFVPELGKKTVSDDETVKSMDIGKGGIDIDTVNDETHVETVKHIPFSSVEHDGVPQATVDFRTDLKDDVRTATFDDGSVGHFDQYTKVSTSSDPDKVIPAVRFDNGKKVNVDGTEDSYVDSFQSLSKDDDGNLTPEGVTKLKPYTSVLRDDDSTASKVKIEHDTNNKLTALSMPATGERYTVQSTNVQNNGKTQEDVQFKTDSKDDVRSVTFDDGKVEHFDQYTKVSKSSDPDKVIPAVRFDDSEKVKVDGTEDSYVDSFQSLSKDDDGNLTPEGTTKLKPYTSVLRDDDSTASKVKIEHDANNLLTALSLPATGEKYTVPVGAPASKSGTSVVDADNATQVADTASLKGDANGNLTSVALSTGKNYTVKSGTAVADADTPSTVADKMQLKGDSSGNLTSVALSTGKNYTIPTPAPQKPSTAVADADAPTTVADSAKLKGDSKGNLTSVTLSTGTSDKTFNIPPQPVIPKHTDVVDADNATQVADKASLKGDANGNLTSIVLSTGKTFNVPTQQGGTGSGTLIVRQGNEDPSKVSYSDAEKTAYKRVSFHTINENTGDGGWNSIYTDGVTVYPKGTIYDTDVSDTINFKPYTSVLDDSNYLIGRMAFRKTDIDSGRFGNSGDTLLKAITFPSKDGKGEDHPPLVIPRPFRLEHVFQKEDPQYPASTIWADFDKISISLGNIQGTYSPLDPAAAEGGQLVKTINLYRYAHVPNELTTSFTIDVSSLNLVIKKKVQDN